MADDVSIATITFTGTARPPSQIYNYRTAVRVAYRLSRSTAPFRIDAAGVFNAHVYDYRSATRVAGLRDHELVQMFIDTKGRFNSRVYSYRQSVRVAGGRVIERTGVRFTAAGTPNLMIRVWNGTQFIMVPARAWDGTQWVNPSQIMLWNGSNFIQG